MAGGDRRSARDEVVVGGKPLKSLKRSECVKWLNPRRQWIGLPAHPKKSHFKLADQKTELKEIKEEIVVSLTEGVYDSWYEGAPPPVDSMPTYDREVEPKDPGIHYDTDLWTAAFFGRLAELDMYLKIGISVDEQQPSYPSHTALHQAASGGQLDMCKFLVKERANVSIVDDNGNTPMHLAARFNRVDVVAFLRDNQSNSLEVNVLNRDFFTPRQLAESRGMMEAANLLPETSQPSSSKAVSGSSKQSKAAKETKVEVDPGSGGALDLFEEATTTTTTTITYTEETTTTEALEEQPVMDTNQEAQSTGGEEAPVGLVL
jgi:hypothetical protein